MSATTNNFIMIYITLEPPIFRIIYDVYHLCWHQLTNPPRTMRTTTNIFLMIYITLEPPIILHCENTFFVIFLTFCSIVFPFFFVKKTFCCDHNSVLPPLCLWQTNHYTSLVAGTSLQAHLEPWAQPPIILRWYL